MAAPSMARSERHGAQGSASPGPPSGDCALWAQPPPPRRSPPCVSQDLKPAGPTGSPRGRDAGGTHLAASCTHGSEATGLRGWSRCPAEAGSGFPGRQGPRGRGGCREAGAKLTSSGRGFCRARGLRLPARGFLPLGCRPEASRLDRLPAELCFPPPPSTPSPKAQLHLPAPGCPAGSSDLIFLLSLPLPSRPPKPSQFLPSLPVGK